MDANKPNPLNELDPGRIDDLLAETESLAAMVAEQVGVETPTEEQSPAPSPRTEVVPEATNDAEADAATGDSAVDLDTRLSEMEALTKELSQDSPPAQEPEPVPPPEPVAGQEPDAPDPAETANAATADDDKPVEAPVVAEGAADGEVPEPALEGKQPESGAPEAISDASTAQVSTAANSTATVASPRSRFGVGTILLSPVYAVGGVLWVIDVPFSWMGRGLKNILGYIGLVTLLAAGVVWYLGWQRGQG